jgi:Domain of unknown function (DUF4803)
MFLSHLDHLTTIMHQNRQHNFSSSMWFDFADSLVSKAHQHNLLNQMDFIYKIVTEGSAVSASFLGNLLKYYKRSKDNQRCEMITSPQQTFIEFIREMYAAETKTYILIAFAYQMLATREPKKKYATELELATEYFFNRSTGLAEMLRDHAGKLDPDFWVCSTRVDKQTAFQMNKFIYGYMDSEIDLHGDCVGSCSEIKDERGFEHLHSDIKRRCMGSVRNCRSTKSQKFDYCFAKNPESSYMYEYVENDVLKRGAKEMCSNDTNPLQNVSLRGKFHCLILSIPRKDENRESTRFAF